MAVGLVMHMNAAFPELKHGFRDGNFEGKGKFLELSKVGKFGALSTKYRTCSNFSTDRLNSLDLEY